MARKPPKIHEFEDEPDGDTFDLDEAQASTDEDAEAEAKKRTVPFSMKVADVICERISMGEPLQAICVGDDMPTVPQVIRWLRKYAKFEELYEQALVLQADYLAGEALMIVAEIRRNPTKAAALKAAADLLAKQAEWRAPRKYGPKMDLNITDRPKTPDEIKAEIARLREELGVPTGRIARLK